MIILMEDLGRDTLEQKSSPAAYAEAVTELAKMRMLAASQLSMPGLIQTPIYRSSENHIEIATRAKLGLAERRPDLAGSLDQAFAIMPSALQSLYTGVKPTIVHGDFHAKNLIY